MSEKLKQCMLCKEIGVPLKWYCPYCGRPLCVECVTELHEAGKDVQCFNQLCDYDPNSITLDDLHNLQRAFSGEVSELRESIEQNQKWHDQHLDFIIKAKKNIRNYKNQLVMVEKQLKEINQKINEKTPQDTTPSKDIQVFEPKKKGFWDRIKGKKNPQ